MNDERIPTENDEEVRQEAGQEISAEEFERQLEIAREVMRERRDVLQKLAQS
jgi:hypothetical protein